MPSELRPGRAVALQDEDPDDNEDDSDDEDDWEGDEDEDGDDEDDDEGVETWQVRGLPTSLSVS